MSEETVSEVQANPEPVQETVVPEVTPEATPETTPEVKEEPAKEETPQAYTEFVLPEGVELDGGMMKAFQDLAKKGDLSQELAQEFVDLQASGLKATQDKINQQITETNEVWKSEVLVMDDFKGERGLENIQSASDAFKKLGGDEFAEYLETTGLGNHPTMVKMGFEIHKLISEDTLVNGDASATGPKTLENALYGGE